MLAKQDDSWINASYYVQSLPHTLSILKWEYGQMDEANEKEYIRQMFNLTFQGNRRHESDFLAELIAKAQKLLREYSVKHLVNVIEIKEEMAELFARSTVSQRDIKRVFSLQDWLQTWFKTDTKYGKKEDNFKIEARAFYVAIGLVYYFRLNEKDRADFKKQMATFHKSVGSSGVPQSFEGSLNDEMVWIGEVIDLPTGIAPTIALKENIFAIIVCSMANIPVLVVGPPGSSKTLSFNIVVDNCRGQESKHCELRNCNIFKCLYPHPYQCSRKSTSSEIETVFHRAINRQQSIDKTRERAVVMMDEAGLPEDSHESLKVLHYFLDDEPLVITLFGTHF